MTSIIGDLRERFHEGRRRRGMSERTRPQTTGNVTAARVKAVSGFLDSLGVFDCVWTSSGSSRDSGDMVISWQVHTNLGTAYELTATRVVCEKYGRPWSRFDLSQRWFNQPS